jgi:hypothetical protein
VINESISGASETKYSFVTEPNLIRRAFEKLQTAVGDFQRDYDAELAEDDLRSEATRFRAQYLDARSFRDSYLVNGVRRVALISCRLAVTKCNNVSASGATWVSSL